MSDYLGRLAGRYLGSTSVIRPAPMSAFEPSATGPQPLPAPNLAEEVEVDVEPRLSTNVSGPGAGLITADAKMPAEISVPSRPAPPAAHATTIEARPLAVSQPGIATGWPDSFSGRTASPAPPGVEAGVAHGDRELTAGEAVLPLSRPNVGIQPAQAPTPAVDETAPVVEPPRPLARDSGGMASAPLQQHSAAAPSARESVKVPPIVVRRSAQPSRPDPDRSAPPFGAVAPVRGAITDSRRRTEPPTIPRQRDAFEAARSTPLLQTPENRSDAVVETPEIVRPAIRDRREPRASRDGSPIGRQEWSAPQPWRAEQPLPRSIELARRPAQEHPIVEISIDEIEVRAPSPPPPLPADRDARLPFRPPMSLAEYLRRRAER